jgi:Ca2+-binding RTX toxin-like protein
MPDDYTGLLTGSHWSGIEVAGKSTIVTFSFPTTAPGYVAGITDPNLTPAALASWQAFSAGEAADARTAMAAWGDACGLIFIEVAPGQGDINFQKLDFSGTGYDGRGGIAYRPFGDWSGASYPYFTGDLDGSGDVFMNSDLAVDYGTLLHEIGHAIGLKHPTEIWTQFAASPPVVHAVWSVDNPLLTVMSPDSTLQSLAAFDIQAIEYIYGTQAQDGTQVASWSWNAGTQTLTQTGFATDDAIRGSSVKDVMNGAGGNDLLFGLAGNDRLSGSAGNDTLFGGAGTDTMIGGGGDDVYYVTETTDVVTESLNAGFDTIWSTVNKTMNANIERLYLMGTAATGNGNDLNNEIYAGSVASTLNGKVGDDYLVGAALKDKISGGTGADYMFGQGGADVFIFADAAEFGTTFWDAIGDFSHAQRDRIDLRGIDPDTVTAGDQAFSFVGTDAFTVDTRFQVRYEVSGGNTTVQIDMNHDTVADYNVILYGVTALVAGDFLL